jgi:hypothetical protein
MTPTRELATALLRMCVYWLKRARSWSQWVGRYNYSPWALDNLEQAGRNAAACWDARARLMGEAGIHLRGWWCPCRCFNGEEKAVRAECRACGREKTT